MKQRGRKSAAALAVSNVVPLRALPVPPKYLTEPQQETWRLVMASRAGEMIAPEAYPVLVEYCRARSSADQIAEQLDAFKTEWCKTDGGLLRWERLLRMQDRAQGKVSSLAVKLRLSPSTRVHPERAGTIARGVVQERPWEDAEEL